MDLQYVEIPIGSLDTSTDPTSLPPGSLTQADNVSADTAGIYEKRYGYTAIAGTGMNGTIIRLAARGNELIACDGEAISSYHGPDVDAWRIMALAPGTLTSQATVSLDQTQDLTKGTRCTVNGVTVHAWIAAGSGVSIKLVSATTGAVLQAGTSGGVAPDYVHAAAAGNLVIVVYSRSAGQTVSYMIVDTAALTVGAEVVYQSGANVSNTAGLSDVYPLNATDVLIAWNSSTPNIRVARFNVSTQVTSAGPSVVSADTMAANTGLAVIGTTGAFGAVLYFVAATGMRAACFNPATTVQTVAPFTVEAVTAPAAVNCGLVRVDATNVLAVWDRVASGITKQKITWANVTSAGVVTAGGTIFNAALASKPTTDPSGSALDPYLLNVWAPYTAQYSYFSCRISRLGTVPQVFPIAMHGYRSAFTSLPAGQLSDVDKGMGGSTVAFSAAVAYKFLSTSVPRAGFATFVLDQGSAARMLPVEAIGTTCFAGLGFRYDGTIAKEINFLLYPQITQATPGAVGAAGMDNGTYSYIVIFESADALGNTDRSTTSVAVAATTVAGAGLGKVTLTIDSLVLSTVGSTQLGSPTGIASVFRTTANGTSYRYVGSVTMNPQVASVTYVDQAHDSTITSNRLLYTDGGALDREPPPPSMQMVLHRNRLWGISSADRKVLFYSGELSPGEGPWFSSLQQVRIDQGGDVLAIASQDDKLVVFKSDRIFRIFGSGANALGQANDLSPPLQSNVDSGCSNPRSVVSFGGGTMHMDSIGLKLLSRGDESTFFGSPVDTYIAGNTVAAANLVPLQREARFELSTGKKAVFNYGTGRWSTHSNYLNGVAVDAKVVNGVYYWATGFNVYKEKVATDVNPWLDPGSTYVPETIEFAWIAPAGKQGLARMEKVMALAERKAAHDLVITTSVNYDAGTTVSTVADATLVALPREQVRLRLTSQKLQSVRVKLADQAPAGATTGQGFNVRGLAFMAGAKKGAFDKRMSTGAKF